MPFTNQTEEKQIERAVLVGLSCPSFNADQDADERTMDELRALAETAGAEAVAMTLQRRPAPDARTFIGEGKAEEVKQLAEMNDASLILFDNELSPSQMSNLEELTGRTVLDRSALILDIFAQRARTGEGKLQVELAQYQYILPRLAGMGKAMSRLGGGIGTRGPGESKLESDRRHIRSRIDKLRRDLEQVRQVRSVQRRQRKKAELPLVAIVGYTNAGKSTLINAIMGKKIAITSNTAQTTRHRFRAVLTREGFQLILVDTPGLHKPHDALGEELNTSALKALEDVDVVAFLVDASKPVGTGDEWVAAQLKRARSKKILVLSKIDLVDGEQLDRQRFAAAQLGDWDAVVELSSQTGEHVQDFVDEVVALLPPGPAWFPTDMETDQPIEVVVAEFIREKILRSFHDEVPHAIGVRVEEMEYDRKKDLYRIFAIVYVERDSQKGIIIGKKGAAIKQIGTEARQDLEQLLGCRVFLDLSVKVKKNWRRDANQIRRFGYGEGA